MLASVVFALALVCSGVCISHMIQAESAYSGDRPMWTFNPDSGLFRFMSIGGRFAVTGMDSDRGVGVPASPVALCSPSACPLVPAYTVV